MCSNMITALGSTMNIVEEERGGGYRTIQCARENLTLIIKKIFIHTSSKNDGESGYDLNLELRVSYSRRSGLVGKT